MTDLIVTKIKNFTLDFMDMPIERRQIMSQIFKLDNVKFKIIFENYQSQDINDFSNLESHKDFYTELEKAKEKLMRQYNEPNSKGEYVEFIFGLVFNINYKGDLNLSCYGLN
jgi:hypothetical protein